MALVQSHHQTAARKKVAIAGFDVEGHSNWRYLSRSGVNDITVLDEREVETPEGVATILGPGVFDELLDFDEVWRTPGLPPHRIKTTGEVTSNSIEFFRVCPAPIIGVTGTKGKGTTASLIYEMLLSAGLKAHLVGNIGQPALDVLSEIKAEDHVVYELSSFQLWDMKQSPHIAVVLMIEPEHLDRHRNLDDYVSAKANICRWQDINGLSVYHPNNPLSAKAAKIGLGRKVRYLHKEGARIEDDKLMIEDKTIMPVSEFGLIGQHNHENIAAAVTAVWPLTQDTAALARAIAGFKGLEHRLQIIADQDGVTFVDDSFATTPATAVAAIASFSQPKVLILGGSDKGSDYQALGKAVAGANMRKVILIGQMGPVIAKTLDEAGYKDYELVEGDMTDIVSSAKSYAQAGDVVLLSPACASFDMFKDYKDRAEQFRQAVGR